METLLSDILRWTGTYEGEGSTHTQDRFEGWLRLRPVVGERGATLEFTAQGEDGHVFHEELTLIATSLDGALLLQSLHTGSPHVAQLSLRREEAAPGGFTLVFGEAYDPVHPQRTRLEITLELLEGSRIGYHHGWSVGTEPVQARSGLILDKVDAPERDFLEIPPA